jgi:hypothetical protein
MFPEFRTRISQLRELVAAGMWPRDIDTLTTECASLAQDRGAPLVFFVLKSIFQSMAQVIDGEPLSPNGQALLTQDLQPLVTRVLEKLENGLEPTLDELNQLVWTHLSGVALFKAQG